MKFIINHNKNVCSTFIKEEYIPIQVVFSNAELNKHIGYYFNDTDLAEFCIDPETNIINKFVLPFSNHYTYIDTIFETPDCSSGELQLIGETKNLCDSFNISCFKNAIQITLSNSTPEEYISEGQLILGLDKDKQLAEIIITSLSQVDVDFAYNELTLG